VSSHHARIRQYMDLETRSLQVAADRARVLDHNGNRGSDAEFVLREWLRRRVEPEYTVSAGEIIDAFDTDADLDSRQQDIVIHQNSRRAKALELPSGLRLIPIETVAVVVEVKLSLDHGEFVTTEAAAAQTARLRLGVRWEPKHEGGAGGGSVHDFDAKRFNEETRGCAVLTHGDLIGRTTFAVFGFGGTSQVETLAGWAAEAEHVSLIACLGAGCVYRHPLDPRWGVSEFGHGTSTFEERDALLAFAQCIDDAVGQHSASAEVFVPRGRGYRVGEALTFWDGGLGYTLPLKYKPTQEELEERARRFPGRSFER
jgi:hypothetical protein